MWLRSPEAAQQTGFLIFLPLTFISSAFVPSQGMPGWLQPVADWNPMSALAAVVCWAVGMLVVFAPLAVHLYRRKALG